MRRIPMLAAATAAVVAVVGGITVAATAIAEPAVNATSTRVAAVESDVVTTPGKPVANTAQRAGAQATPTTIVWTRRSTWVTYGGQAMLEGQVQAGQSALPGARVELYARSSTSKPWIHVDSATTSTTTGLFRFYRTPPRNYYFGVAYGGNAAYEPSAAYAKVGVRRKLTPSHMTSAPRGNFYYYGPVKPGGKGTLVKLQYKKCGSCGWQYLKYTRANSNSVWKFTVSGPSTSGRTYFYRAYTPSSSSYMAGYADEWRIRT